MLLTRLVLWLCLLPTEFGIKSNKYWGVLLFFILWNKISLWFCLISDSFSHLVSSYNLLSPVNLVPPVTILAASSRTFSNLFIKLWFWESQITLAYSSTTRYKLVSSAKKFYLSVNILNNIIMNRRGTSMDPWGTPALIDNQSEFEPFISTLWDLPLK
jgi:hypothetical protein